jgi:hypothetical protein
MSEQSKQPLIGASETFGLTPSEIVHDFITPAITNLRNVIFL